MQTSKVLRDTEVQGDSRYGGRRCRRYVCGRPAQLGFKGRESAVSMSAVPGFAQGSSGCGWGGGRGAGPPPEFGSRRGGAFPAGGGQAVLTRCLPRAFRPTGLLMVAKFPKSSASGPVPLFASHCQCFLPPPQSSALRRVSEKFDRGNSQRRQGNPAQLATASLASPIDRRASRTPARHRSKLSPTNSPPVSHSSLTSWLQQTQTQTRERETLPFWPRLPLLNPLPATPHQLPSPRPRPRQLVASCRIP